MRAFADLLIKMARSLPGEGFSKVPWRSERQYCEARLETYHRAGGDTAPLDAGESARARPTTSPGFESKKNDTSPGTRPILADEEPFLTVDFLPADVDTYSLLKALLAILVRRGILMEREILDEIERQRS